MIYLPDIKASFNLIIAGGRDFSDSELLETEFDSYVQEHTHGIPVIVVSGMAQGADMLGAQLARARGLKLHKFPADWKEHGRGAGFIRNNRMAVVSDGLLAFWDGKSKGTSHMIQTATRDNLIVKVVMYGGKQDE